MRLVELHLSTVKRFRSKRAHALADIVVYLDVSTIVD